MTLDAIVGIAAVYLIGMVFGYRWGCTDERRRLHRAVRAGVRREAVDRRRA